MKALGKKGQGEALIKVLVVAIIAIIALALVKSYFREASRKVQKTAEEIFTPVSTGTSSSAQPPLMSFTSAGLPLS